jgi:hypothetical protein
VIERNLGGFAGHGDIETLPDTWIMHCCTANASQALYYAWDGIVRENGRNTAQINLLLNRASPCLDLDSYLPHQGKVTIKNKTAERILVRIPGWVSRGDVRSRMNSTPVEPIWANNYVLFENAKPGDEIEIAFPVIETTTTATLENRSYRLRFRGGTLVGFSSGPAVAGIRCEEGSLVLPGSARVLVEGIAIKDAKVSVDVKGSAEAGIMLRWQDAGNFLLAIYANGGIYFHEVVNGNYGPFLDFVPAPGLRENLHLAAEVKGSEATLALTDGAKTVTTQHSITSAFGGGGVGLFHNGAPAQRFDSFHVADLQGNAVFEDAFDEPNWPVPGWKVVDRGAGGPNDYPIYRREDMRDDRAPTVKKTRCVLDRRITG